ncbi:hypothetical protein PsYK624_074800 [Phanerochaete sordida]|uniref:Uncharacterized protein n=1 Tax=Phanerochaete sordida TaxID=48140 RepID=A0A9P3LDA6_9APHY|nr:hypothetical protein PsYK624_074800 [Phanerochaete sordida]
MPGTDQASARDWSRKTCTCDSCVDGWLSPRMKERLEGEGDFLRYVSISLLSDLGGLPEDEVLPDWVIAEDPSLHFIPMELHTKMSPAFYRGYAVVVDVMVQILQRPAGAAAGCVPTPTAIEARLRELCTAARKSGGKAAALTPDDVEDVEAFLHAGGEAEFALEALTDRAMEKSPAGSEFLRRPAIRVQEEELAGEVGELPVCANDLDFELVRKRLGLPPHFIGPHWFFLTDSESEDDIDGDDSEDVYAGQRGRGGEGAVMKRRDR